MMEELSSAFDSISFSDHIGSTNDLEQSIGEKLKELEEISQQDSTKLSNLKRKVSKMLNHSTPEDRNVNKYSAQTESLFGIKFSSAV